MNRGVAVWTVTVTAFLLLCRVSLVLQARSAPQALPACRCVSGRGAWHPNGCWESREVGGPAVGITGQYEVSGSGPGVGLLINCHWGSKWPQKVGLWALASGEGAGREPPSQGCSTPGEESSGQPPTLLRSWAHPRCTQPGAAVLLGGPEL